MQRGWADGELHGDTTANDWGWYDEAMRKLTIAKELYLTLPDTDFERAACEYEWARAMEGKKQESEAIQQYENALHAYESLTGAQDERIRCQAAIDPPSRLPPPERRPIRSPNSSVTRTL